MLFAQKALQLENPVHDPGFTANEIQELLSLFQSPTTSQNSASEGSNQAVYSMDERKRRRMILNRESARRSRWRKKKHLEDLTETMNQLKVENRDLKNRLGSLLNQCHVLWRENDYLMSEYVALTAKLADFCHVLVAMNAMQQPL